MMAPQKSYPFHEVSIKVLEDSVMATVPQRQSAQHSHSDSNTPPATAMCKHGCPNGMTE